MRIDVDTNAAAAAIERTPATIRRWAQRGLIAPVGTDGQRRRLWDLAQVIACAQKHPPRPDVPARDRHRLGGG